METAQLEGKRYQLFFEGEGTSYTYTETVDHYSDRRRTSYFWQGSMKVVDKQSSREVLANFRSHKYTTNPRARWPEEIDTLEKAVFLVRKDVVRRWGENDVLDLSKIVNRELVVDLLSEKVLALIAEIETETIPTVVIPLIKLSELEALGLAPSDDGQLVFLGGMPSS